MEVIATNIVIVVPNIKTALESTSTTSVVAELSGLVSTSVTSCDRLLVEVLVSLLGAPVLELDDFVLTVPGRILLGLDRKDVVVGLSLLMDELLLGLLVVVLVVVAMVVVVVAVVFGILGRGLPKHARNLISHISVFPHVPTMKYCTGPGTEKVMPLLPCCDPSMH